MGSFHIIDGEKVSIKYSGQEWSCARCHKFKRECPGLAIARDCTDERVLLSTHMATHWSRIGYKPDAEATPEADEAPELEIQIGQIKEKTAVVPTQQLKNKHKSVVVKGFSPKSSPEEIFNELLNNGYQLVILEMT